MLGVILGAISLILSVLLAVAIHSFTSFDIMSFSIFYVIPLGSIIIGTIACLGYYWGLFITNKKINFSLLIIGLLIPIIAYIGVQYGYYTTAYLDENMSLNYKMEGEHISNYAIGDSDEPLDFISFTKLMVDSRVISFYNRKRAIGDVEGNAILNWTFFIIDGLGAIFGSIVALGLVKRNTKYCDDCKRYMKNKSILKFLATDLDRTIRFQDIDNLSPDKIKELFLPMEVGKNEHYEIIVHWCEMCDKGYLEMKYMEKNSKGEMTENDKRSKEFEISADTIKTIRELSHDGFMDKVPL